MDLSPVAVQDMRSVALSQFADADSAWQSGQIFKRGFDLIVAAFALVILSPMLLLIAGILKLTSPGPIVFAHARLGKGGGTFDCLKFRTMVVNSQEVLVHHLEENAAARVEWSRDHKLRNDPRITPIGKFLRRTSLDELPQLINVLRGEMSMVGPRPIVRDEIVKYGRYFVAYASVAPGITGLWQVSGRNNVSYRRRVAIDTAYARNRSFQGDIVIMLRTVSVVFVGSGW